MKLSLIRQQTLGYRRNAGITSNLCRSSRVVSLIGILCCFLFGGMLYFSLENCMDRDLLVRISVMLPNGVQEVPEKNTGKKENEIQRD